MNISLITACKDRNECLQAVLPSWLQHNEITEIIIVDWSSKESLKHLINLNKKIKVVRVDSEKYYVPSQANNLAAQVATGKNLLRVDTDYFFNPYYNFFETYKIDKNSFVSGEPEVNEDRENNPYYKYLFGLLYITKENFLKVNGYNEDIGYYYSHEDKDIFDRLKLIGLQQIKLKNNHCVVHIPHSDKKRFEYFEGGQNVTTDENITVEVHIGKNLNTFKQPSSAHVENTIKWNINKVTEQYFEATKITNNSLQGLPQINCISLKESEERRKVLLEQFKQYGITNINFLLSKRFTECKDQVTGNLLHTLSDGHKGCSVSHLKMIKNWYDNTDQEYGFFCEDDLSLKTVPFWNKPWNKFINSLPFNWECVQLLYLKDDGNICSLNLKEREWNDWSVTCYILKRSYAKKIIDKFIKDGTYHLELFNNNTQPLIENILFTELGKVYSVPLFVENIKYNSTFSINYEHNTELHQITHINSHNKVLTMWTNKKDKIVDFFTFYEPLGKEIFELRINMLKDYVDKFVVCESNKTQSGANTSYKLKDLIKQLNFTDLNIDVIELQIPEDKDLIITEEDKINCYENNFINENSLKARARERLQKDSLLQILDNYTDNSVFIHSDIDEIINPKNISWIANIVKQNQNFLIKIPLVHLEGRADLRVYHKDTNQPKEWTGMFMATKQHFKKATPTQLRSNVNNPFSINFVTQNNKVLKDLGWHFSWMGDANIRKTKCQNFTHYDDTFSFLATSKYKNKDTENFQNNLIIEENSIPPSCDKNLILKKYSMQNLPKEIFALHKIRDFLLPGVNFTDFDLALKEYSLDIENPVKNFKVGYCYYQQGHTAPALSYFLRCAERTDDILLAYEALIFGYFCYKEQKIRDETAKSLIMHAVTLLPNRPEARYLLSCFYEQKQNWMDTYYHACLGLSNWSQEQHLQYYKDYPGKVGLLFQKAISGYWWGKNEECKNILLDLYNNYELTGDYKHQVIVNLKRIGIEIS